MAFDVDKFNENVEQVRSAYADGKLKSAVLAFEVEAPSKARAYQIYNDVVYPNSKVDVLGLLGLLNHTASRINHNLTAIEEKPSDSGDVE